MVMVKTTTATMATTMTTTTTTARICGARKGSARGKRPSENPCGWASQKAWGFVENVSWLLRRSHVSSLWGTLGGPLTSKKPSALVEGRPPRDALLPGDGKGHSCVCACVRESETRDGCAEIAAKPSVDPHRGATKCVRLVQKWTRGSRWSRL
eukprot:2477052-Pyramimonas_sp.AAC.1